MIAKSKHARALAIRHRIARQVRRHTKECIQRADKAERSLAITQRDLAGARERLREALPVYARAQELERRHYGQQFVLPIVFNPQCIWRASLDVNLLRRDHDVYELDSQARWVAQDAAQKIHHTIMEEIRKQTGIPGGPYGR